MALKLKIGAPLGSSTSTNHPKSIRLFLNTIYTQGLTQNALKDTFETFKTIDFNNCSYLNNSRNLGMETAFFVQAPPKCNIST